MGELVQRKASFVREASREWSVGCGTSQHSGQRIGCVTNFDKSKKSESAYVPSNLNSAAEG